MTNANGVPCVKITRKAYFMGKNEEKFRARMFRFLLYPNEDKTHKVAFEYIKANYDYASIEHNQDTDKITGKLIKSHTHVVLQVSNPKWNTALAKELGITPNYIMKCDNFNGALEYLIHFNDSDKFQYDISEVKGPLAIKVRRLLKNYDKDENDKVLELLDFIENSNLLEISDFLRYCCSIGYYDVARRSSNYFMRLIDNHNSNLIDSSYNIYYSKKKN